MCQRGAAGSCWKVYVRHIHIVGFGIAGALIAHELLRQGLRVTISDTFDSESSSRVAAGMITPITGKRLKPTWRGPELTSIAERVYREIGEQAERSLWRDWTLRRVFREPQMQTWFADRHQRGEFNHLAVHEIAPGEHDGTNFPFGGFMHGGVATVDLSSVIETVRGRVECLPTIPEQPDATVWCTGYHALHHELWSWLPIEPSKGEILDVQIPDLRIDHILTNGTWILPVPESDGSCGATYRIGATHDWDDHDPRPTEVGRDYLLQQAMMMVSHNIIVTNHRAAIRPSTQFKRPLVGRHPQYADQYVFTGLGTKGALQGPWAAQQLVALLLEGSPLDNDVDCARWWTKG